MAEQRERARAGTSAARAADKGDPRPPSQKRLKELLRDSRLVPPELRAHWLRVLPYLTDQQRRELATLLGGESASGPAAPA
jgi:hypothetical protein